MPSRSETDGYKSCWEARLERDNVSEDECDMEKNSAIEFYDRKGSAHVAFQGLKEDSAAAIDLVNLLVLRTCPHTYDGYIAGRG